MKKKATTSENKSVTINNIYKTKQRKVNKNKIVFEMYDIIEYASKRKYDIVTEINADTTNFNYKIQFKKRQ